MPERNACLNPELYDTSGDGLSDGAWFSSFERVRTGVAIAHGTDTQLSSSPNQHGVSVGDKVYVYDSTSTPSIDGVHSVKALQSTTGFSIEIETTVDGTCSYIPFIGSAGVSQTNPYLVGSDGVYMGKAQKFVYRTAGTALGDPANEGSTAFLHLGRTGADSVRLRTGVSWSKSGGNVVVTDNGHGLKVGERVYFSNSSDAALDGGETITAADTNTFTVAETVTNASGTTDYGAQIVASAWVRCTITDSNGDPSPVGAVDLRIYQWTGTWGPGYGAVSGAATGSDGTYVTADGEWHRHQANLYDAAAQRIHANCNFVDVSLTLGTADTSNLTFTVEVCNLEIQRDTGVKGWFDGIWGGTWEGTAHNSASTQDVAEITGIEPASGPPGQDIVITGTDFGTAGEVTFDDVAGPTPTYWSPTNIAITVPVGATGTLDVAVIPSVSGSGGGSTSLDGTFQVATPSLTSLEPALVAPGDHLTISGLNLGTALGTVRMGTLSCEVLSWRVLDAAGTSQVVVVVPDVAPGSQNLYLTPAGGTELGPLAVTIMDNPFIIRVGGKLTLKPQVIIRKSSALKGVYEAWLRSGGALYELAITPYAASGPSINSLSVYSGVSSTPVTIRGSGFGATPGTSTVKFDTYTAITTSWSDTEIVALVPSSASGEVDVKVTVATVDSNLVPFTAILSNGNKITVSVRTVEAINSALAGATPGRDWVYVPGGAPYNPQSGTVGVALQLRDRVNLRGDGIAIPNSSGQVTNGGTWIRAPIRLASYALAEKFLVGYNVATRTCKHQPTTKGLTSSGNPNPAGPDTQTGGVRSQAFSFVRFKGGNDGGEALFDTAFSNFGRGLTIATNSLGMAFLRDCVFDDCEFERPQGPGQAVFVAGVMAGPVVNLHADMRAGAAVPSGNHWNRCHFGVRNGYRTGAEGYGIGQTFIYQAGPNGSETALAGNPDCGPRISINIDDPNTPIAYGSGCSADNWNPSFDWDQLAQHFLDERFVDCLFEYSLWAPFNITDSGRIYSMWHGIYESFVAAGQTPRVMSVADATAVLRTGRPGDPYYNGYGNPPGSAWTSFPDNVWSENFSFLRCYHKGGMTGQGNVNEVTKDSWADYCFMGCGKTWMRDGYGCSNNKNGGFSNTTRPQTDLFPTDWTGGVLYHYEGTKLVVDGPGSYTPSPFDPA